MEGSHALLSNASAACSLKDMLYKRRMERQLAAARGEGPGGERPPDEVSITTPLSAALTIAHEAIAPPSSCSVLAMHSVLIVHSVLAKHSVLTLHSVLAMHSVLTMHSLLAMHSVLAVQPRPPPASPVFLPTCVGTSSLVQHAL